ncbi:Shiga toxin A subunit [Enterobacteriaceae bacterium 89]|nr:Shiga toxin A subunit [Enterobacteriaceae bacterium 89]
MYIRKILIFTFSTFSFLVHAEDYGCAAAGASMESALFSKLSTDLGIDTSSVNEMTTTVEVLDISPISRVYAEYLARADFNKDPDKDKTEHRYNKIYFSSYYENEVKSITAKYTYFNKQNKKDVFIATSLMNKHECSIRFNGYIILSREF